MQVPFATREPETDRPRLRLRPETRKDRPMLLYTTLRKTTFSLWLAAWVLLSTTHASAQPGLLGAQYSEQEVGFIPDSSELGDVFGAAVAHGDFNCDGYQDLAVGVPEENLFDGVINGGQVTVIFGSQTGLDHTTAIYLSQEFGLLVGGPAGSHHRFGASLAAGNFDNNHSAAGPCDDLAIGVPGMILTDFPGDPRSGAVIVLPGHSPASSILPAAA